MPNPLSRSGLHTPDEPSTYRCVSCRKDIHACTGGRCTCDVDEACARAADADQEPALAALPDPTSAAPSIKEGPLKARILAALAQEEITDPSGHCTDLLASRIAATNRSVLGTTLYQLEAAGHIERDRVNSRVVIAIRLARQAGAEPATDTTPAPRATDEPVATPAAVGVAEPRRIDTTPNATPATPSTPTPRPMHLINGDRIITHGEQEVLEHLTAATNAFRALRDRTPGEAGRWDLDVAHLQDLVLARAARRTITEKGRP